MTKYLISAIFLVFLTEAVYGQQQQSGEDPFFYKVSGLVYVQEYNSLTRSKTSNLKIPKEPLKFRIVSKETESSDNSTYYVIQFLRIKPESDETVKVTITGKGENKTTTREVLSTLKGSSVFINSDDNDKYFWLRKDELDNYMADGFITKSYKTPNTNIAYGANISLPFKLRPETNGQNIKITPDLTLGGYLGIKWRISKTKPFYLTAPIVTLGLATLSINDNSNTATPSKGDGTVLGITGSTGLVFQLDDFQFGFMLGRDRAAGEIGKDWIYNNKTWYSFSIGYSFLGNNSDKNK